jgi:ADP-ribose pyrophosphatase YjhB (NUDIX family)
VTRDRVRVAAYAVVRDERDRILLCHIAPSVGIGDVWTLPGGGLDFGEAPARAVLRELEEETGFVGQIDRLVDVSDRLHDLRDDERLHAIRIVYEVRITGGVQRDEPEGSTDACRWFAAGEVQGLHLGELARRAVERVARRAVGGADPTGDADPADAGVDAVDA